MPKYTFDLNLAIFGHESAYPDLVAEAFGGLVNPKLDAEFDGAIFVINPNTGIDQETIENWQKLDEFVLPRLIVVIDLEKDAADFDDAVLMANRLFDQVATPYLVLHGDDGIPCAVISLFDMMVTDYSTVPPIKRACEPEHETLVQEFRDEYIELVTALGEGAFAAGVLFPAIPLWLEKNLGTDIVISYLNQLKK